MDKTVFVYCYSILLNETIVLFRGDFSFIAWRLIGVSDALEERGSTYATCHAAQRSE